MRQTAVITLISVAVLAAVSLATPVEEVSLATPVEEESLATSVEEVSEQIDDENFAESLLDMLEIDIPDDMVVSSIDISINLVPKDSSKEVENVENVIPETGGRGRAPGRARCFPPRRSGQRQQGSNQFQGGQHRRGGRSVRRRQYSTRCNYNRRYVWNR